VGVSRIERLSDEQEARLEEWAERWVEIGLRTGPAERERFEAAVRACYEFSGFDWHGVVVWVPSPLVLALAAPAAAYLIDTGVRSRSRARLRRADHRLGRSHLLPIGVRSVTEDAVAEVLASRPRSSAASSRARSRYESEGGSLRELMVEPVAGGVRSAIEAAVGGDVFDRLWDMERLLNRVVGGASGYAVQGIVYGSIFMSVRRALAAAESEIRSRFPPTHPAAWEYHLAGQLWPGGIYSPAFTSFFRDVCNLELAGDLWDRARAYEETVESACWWWPHSQFTIVSERPLELHAEPVDGSRIWRVLHREDGPTLAWANGERTHHWRGLPAPEELIERPETLSAQRILAEPNLEVRRAMLERIGYEPLMAVADSVQKDDYGELLRIDQPDDEPVLLVKVVNSTPEPDGSFRDYLLRVPPFCQTAREAVAWSFDIHPDDYQVARET
jgi:Domain of unknown function (DUF6745)